jgi:hypothetical protein
MDSSKLWINHRRCSLLAFRQALRMHKLVNQNLGAFATELAAHRFPIGKQRKRVVYRLHTIIYATVGFRVI